MDYKKKLLEQWVMVRGRFLLLFACWGDSVSTRTHSSKWDGRSDNMVCSRGS